MSTFHVYSNAKSEYEAIPEDFSIGALLLGGVWALAKRLFKIGAALVAVDALAVYAMRVGQQTGAATWVIGGLVAMLIGRVFIAMRGAVLREDSMPRRGFQFVATVSAIDADTAIRRAVREELSESERADATGSMPRVAAAPSAFVQDRPGTRSEFDIDALRGGDSAPPGSGDPAGDTDGSDAGTPDQPRWEPRASRTGRDDRADDGADEDGDWDQERRRRRMRLAAIAGVALAIVAGSGYAGWYFLIRTPTSASGDDANEMAAVEAPSVAADEPAPDQPANPGGADVTPSPLEAQGTGPAVAVSAPVATAAQPGLAAPTVAATGTAADSATDAVPQPKPRPLSPAEIEAAWSRHYKPAPKCVEPADWDTYVECINTMMRQHDAFVTKYSQQSTEADAQAGKRP
jgi:hypothetical protein